MLHKHLHTKYRGEKNTTPDNRNCSLVLLWIVSTSIFIQHIKNVNIYIKTYIFIYICRCVFALIVQDMSKKAVNKDAINN